MNYSNAKLVTEKFMHRATKTYYLQTTHYESICWIFLHLTEFLNLPSIVTYHKLIT